MDVDIPDAVEDILARALAGEVSSMILITQDQYGDIEALSLLSEDLSEQELADMFTTAAEAVGGEVVEVR